MMPRINAGERLEAITDGAIAAGNVASHDASRIRRHLEDVARGERRKAAKANPAALARMGIAVRGPSAPSQKAANHG